MDLKFVIRTMETGNQATSTESCCPTFVHVRRFFYGLIVFLSTYYLLLLFLFTSSRLTNFREYEYEAEMENGTSPKIRIAACYDEGSRNLTDVRYDYKEIYARHVSNDRPLTPEIWEMVKPAMSTSEKRTMRLILEVFVEVCRTHNFTYFMFSGTLLGSFRHHGIMPWDDDVDLVMRMEEREAILKTFRRNANRGSYVLVETGNERRMKLFHRDQSIRVRGCRYKWPTLDVSFYYENVSHIWENWDRGSAYHVMSKSIIFPLHWRPFETLMLKSPHDAFAVLKSEYTDPHCVSLTWIHREERRPRSERSFACEVVRPIYPFVHRRALGSCVEESLILDGKVLHTIFVNEPTYAITLPYALLIENGTLEFDELSANGKGLNATEKGLNVNDKKSNANGKALNANGKGLNANVKKSNANGKGLNMNGKGLNADDERLNANGKRSNVNGKGLNANDKRLNANYKRLNANGKRSNANFEKDKREWKRVKGERQKVKRERQGVKRE